MGDAPKVVEAFGKYMAQINGNVVTFDTESDALTAVVMEEQAGGIAKRAEAYCEARGLVDKNAAAKTKIVTDFMAYELSLDAEETE